MPARSALRITSCIAAGSQANFFGVPGAAEHAFPLYTVRDADRLRGTSAIGSAR